MVAETTRTGLVASISGSTIWRWWHDDAIRPWSFRRWLFPPAPTSPNDFPSLAAVEQQLLAFQRHYEAVAQSFQWTFTRRDLAKWLDRLAQREAAPAAA